VRMRGTLAKINYAVSALPSFAGVAAPERHAALSGCIRLCPDIDTLERAFDAAKYGQYGSDPWIELAIPSILDPSLAPAGQHVVSAYVQFAPLVALILAVLFRARLRAARCGGRARPGPWAACPN